MNEYRSKYPDRTKANFMIANRIKRGKIKKPSNCEICGKQTRIEGHHPNYEEKLKVIWVCPQCHKNIHCPNKKKVYEKKPVFRKYHKKFQPAPKREKLLIRAENLRQRGKYYQDIAKELNLSIGTVYKWLNEVKYN